MQCLKVDTRKRIRLPSAKPGQVFDVAAQADGSVLLTPIKEPERTGERFPPGSLSRYFSGEAGRKRDADDALIGSGCAQGPE